MTDLLTPKAKSNKCPYFPHHLSPNVKFVPTCSRQADYYTKYPGFIADGLKRPNSIFCREDVWP